MRNFPLFVKSSAASGKMHQGFYVTGGKYLSVTHGQVFSDFTASTKSIHLLSLRSGLNNIPVFMINPCSDLARFKKQP
ncbi:MULTISPECIES: hypothetical protein [Cohaesibacter]|uniref:hypothetical protein n=1 Tax=Cohaesibacter TaxID=655352 RepID=UPI0010FDC0B3|nr:MULTISPECIES: hypothetical protein [Cohaesibacter]TLP44976.1 hypothetical protein FDK21_14555 [Cohaesibacter sp. CAU 1516]